MDFPTLSLPRPVQRVHHDPVQPSQRTFPSPTNLPTFKANEPSHVQSLTHCIAGRLRPHERATPLVTPQCWAVELRLAAQRSLRANRPLVPMPFGLREPTPQALELGPAPRYVAAAAPAHRTTHHVPSGKRHVTLPTPPRLVGYPIRLAECAERLGRRKPCRASQRREGRIAPEPRFLGRRLIVNLRFSAHGSGPKSPGLGDEVRLAPAQGGLSATPRAQRDSLRGR